MKVLMTLSLMLASTMALATESSDALQPRPKFSIDPNNALVLEGPIMNGNLSDIQAALLNAKPDTAIDLIINSPGGSVTTGFTFISILDDARARGVTVICYVPQVAASMAFQILLHCDKRVVLEKAFLLWHRARVFVGGMGGSPMTGPDALTLGRDLSRMDEVIYSEVRRYVDMPEHALRYHFEKETLHIGSQVAAQTGDTFIAVPNVEGLYEALLNPKLPRTIKQQSIFGFRVGEIIHVTNNPSICNMFTEWNLGE